MQQTLLRIHELHESRSISLRSYLNTFKTLTYISQSFRVTEQLVIELVVE